MKQVVYTCAQCGKQEAVDPDHDTVPMEWAAIQYKRIHTVQHAGQSATAQTQHVTHACGDCAEQMLGYIETPHGPRDEAAEGPPRDQLLNMTTELMRVNAQMFEGTIRVLSQQNMRLHEQVTTLMATNTSLCKELEATRASARLP